MCAMGVRDLFYGEHSASAGVSGGTAAFQLDFRGPGQFIAGTLPDKARTPPATHM